MTTCSQCKFFKKNAMYGECRRYPPTMLIQPIRNSFLVVEEHYWCGEFSARTKTSESYNEL